MDKLSEILHRSVGVVVYSEDKVVERFELSTGRSVFIWVDEELSESYRLVVKSFLEDHAVFEESLSLEDRNIYKGSTRVLPFSEAVKVYREYINGLKTPSERDLKDFKLILALELIKPDVFSSLSKNVQSREVLNVLNIVAKERSDRVFERAMEMNRRIILLKREG